MSSFLYLRSFLLPTLKAINFFCLSHCLSVQGLRLRICATWSIVRSEAQVVGFDEENVVALLFSIPYTKLTQENVRCNSMNVKDDAFQLIAEVRRKYPLKAGEARCKIALESGPNITQEDFIYYLPETPHFLFELGILEILDTNPIGFRKDIRTDDELKDIPGLSQFKSLIHLDKPIEHGLMVVNFNLPILEEWFNKELMGKINKDGKIVKFPEGRDHLYENGELHIKLQDGSTCTLDLSKANDYRPVFESFYYLFRDTNKSLFERDEVLKRYKELAKKDIDWRTFIKQKSSIVGKMINPKAGLKNRIVWEHDRATDKYKFEILPLSDK